MLLRRRITTDLHCLHQDIAQALQIVRQLILGVVAPLNRCRWLVGSYSQFQFVTERIGRGDVQARPIPLFRVALRDCFANGLQLPFTQGPLTTFAEEVRPANRHLVIKLTLRINFQIAGADTGNAA